MQIFYTHHNPTKAAQYLYTKSPLRANKIITESIQMLATLAPTYKTNIPTKQDGTPYSTKNHINHPCTQWLHKSRGNVNWLITYLKTLHTIRTKENRPPHKALYNTYADNLSIVEELLTAMPKKNKTKPINFAKSKQKQLDFTHYKQTTKAYQTYLNKQL